MGSFDSVIDALAGRARDAPMKKSVLLAGAAAVWMPSEILRLLGLPSVAVARPV
jgi:hypothetical protein